MNFLKRLTARKSELELQISIRRSMLMNAEVALSAVDRLEKQLPEVISEIESAHCEPTFNQYSTTDFNGRLDLIAQKRAVDAAKRLTKDLPVIRKHWESVVKENAG